MSKLNICGMEFRNPIGTASGTSGNGREFAKFSDLDAIGFFTTKTVTLLLRPGNPQPRTAELPDGQGMRNSIGLENEGVLHLIECDLPYLQRWRQKGLRVVVNISGFSIAEFVQVASLLRACQDLFDILEVNVSCPNVENGSLPFGLSSEAAAAVTQAVRAVFDGPMFVKLTPAAQDIASVAKAVVAAGADGISAINTVPADGSYTPLGAGYGGISGPIIHSRALECVAAIRKVVDVPIIGIGGVTNADDARGLLDAGADLVAVGSQTFIDPMAAPKIAAEF